ncbi:hypothetical protein [Burkholderia cepacia]|uniref:hypothetical protein n=1 Tax=Burkholderia cepacia TaxID=292 RepID=UPI000AA06CB3|nr:hypothetical protein [Burkholderia cepacia]
MPFRLSSLIDSSFRRRPRVLRSAARDYRHAMADGIRVYCERPQILREGFHAIIASLVAMKQGGIAARDRSVLRSA